MDNDQWQIYQRMIDDMPATAMVETSWTEEGPDPDKPVCVIVRIPFESEEDLGLPDTDDEFEALDAMTEALVKALSKHKAYFAGKLMHNFAHSLYFYTPGNDGIEQAVATAISKFKGREADVTCIDDPEWERIGEDVWPTEVEVRWNEDMAVLSALEEGGDDMTTPREIEHMAIFASRETCEQFAEWSRQNGFTVGEPTQDEEDAFSIEFTKVSAPTIEAIFDQTGAITEIAEELGGMYDGWQCRLVKA
jgi:uncharacterized protein (TIGR01619 family)